MSQPSKIKIKVWLRQKHNKLLDSYRFGNAEISRERVQVRCPESQNLLVDCSRKFFDSEVAKERIVLCKPEGRMHGNLTIVEDMAR